MLTELHLNQAKLEECFDKFVKFIASETGEEFKNFKDSKYLYETEHYKYSVYEEAHSNLATKSWTKEDIGTGKIQEKVSSAIKSRVKHNYKTLDNNLVNWRQKDSFSKKITDEKLEQTFFEFYKSNTIKGSKAFKQFEDEGLSYQFIAYLFFIKNKEKYLPISQEKFDNEIFDKIGITDFKTCGNSSWENYSEFLDIIKQVQQFLKTKDKNVTLLDAHSFLWIFTYDNFPFDLNNKENDFTEPNNVVSENNENPFSSSISDTVEKQYSEDYIEAEIDAFVDIQKQEQENNFENDKQEPKDFNFDDSGAIEGYEHDRLTLVRERDVQIVSQRKQLDNYTCQCCGFFMQIDNIYIVDCHHLNPISCGVRETRIEDLISLCPNCHRIAHTRNPPVGIEEIKQLRNNDQIVL